jgi:hypothetical protein
MGNIPTKNVWANPTDPTRTSRLIPSKTAQAIASFTAKIRPVTDEARCEERIRAVKKPANFWFFTRQPSVYAVLALPRPPRPVPSRLSPISWPWTAGADEPSRVTFY